MSKRRSKGEGSIYFNESRERWVAQITLPNGQRKSKSSRVQAEVRDWLISERNQLLDGLYVTDDQVKLGGFLDRYMEDVARYSIRPRTFERYYGIINNHIKPTLGNIKLNALRPDQVQALYSKKLNKGISRHSVRYIHAVLHLALNQALRWGLVRRNVLDLVQKPRAKKQTITTWSAEDHRWYPIYVIAIYTGMR